MSDERHVPNRSQPPNRARPPNIEPIPVLIIQRHDNGEYSCRIKTQTENNDHAVPE